MRIFGVVLQTDQWWYRFQSQFWFIGILCKYNCIRKVNLKNYLQHLFNTHNCTWPRDNNNQEYIIPETTHACSMEDFLVCTLYPFQNSSLALCWWHDFLLVGMDISWYHTITSLIILSWNQTYDNQLFWNFENKEESDLSKKIKGVQHQNFLRVLKTSQQPLEFRQLLQYSRWLLWL